MVAASEAWMRNLLHLAAVLCRAVLCCAVGLQVQKLSSELAEYKAESKAIKNQDLTIRKQDETIQQLTATLDAKDKQLAETVQQAAAEADAALLSKMQVRHTGCNSSSRLTAGSAACVLVKHTCQVVLAHRGAAAVEPPSSRDASTDCKVDTRACMFVLLCCPALQHVALRCAVTCCAMLCPPRQAREAELSDMLGSTQSSLEAMQRLYAAAQNQLFELQSNKEAAVVVKQVGGQAGVLVLSF
jgi:septal ring factor EnvC (AmiA/AmiB activator)